jgi:hypothetical protein
MAQGFSVLLPTRPTLDSFFSFRTGIRPLAFTQEFLRHPKLAVAARESILAEERSCSTGAAVRAKAVRDSS